ncbi:helix-turn-helix domain-containing protein [Streptomyces niveus]|uniref:helix-turn-helix domain-containing protein n=1 Tax=Streptomyces niveus TaxID=193462 RepID=UPI0036895101
MNTGTGGKSGGEQGSGPPQPESRMPLLTMFLRAARARWTHEQLGLEPPEGRVGRRAAGPEERVPGVTQADVAGLLNVSLATYKRMENGNYNWTETQVEALANVLLMDSTQRDRLYVLTLGHYPAMDPGTSRDPDTHLLEFVESIPAQETRGEKGYAILYPIMFATGPLYDIEAYNNGFEALFEKDCVPDNVLKWFLQGGDSQLLEHLLLEAQLRMQVMGRTHGNHARFKEFEELFRSLPPTDLTKARPAAGLQEDIFPYTPPAQTNYEAGLIRSSELHPTGNTGGVSDGSSVFYMTFYEGLTLDELHEEIARGKESLRGRTQKPQRAVPPPGR